MRDAARYLMNTYKRPPVVFTRGKGCYLYDQRGRRYLDFLAGIAVNALGHAHPRLVRVIRREASRAIHVSNLFHNPYQGPLARKLAQWSGMDRVFFTNSGTEAIEGALKLARLHARQKAGGAKTRILALENSFHGRTFGALAITAPAKYREPFAPLVPGVEFVRFNDLADLEAKFDSTVCAIVVETIQGEGGIFPLSEAFWRRARELAPRRPLFRLPAICRAARHCCGGQATGRRAAARCHPGPRTLCGGVFAGPAREHIRRRAAGVRCGAGIPHHGRRGEPAGEYLRAWAGASRRVDAARGEIRFRSRTPRRGLDPGPGVGRRRRPVRR